VLPCIQCYFHFKGVWMVVYITYFGWSTLSFLFWFGLTNVISIKKFAHVLIRKKTIHNKIIGCPWWLIMWLIQNNVLSFIVPFFMFMGEYSWKTIVHIMLGVINIATRLLLSHFSYLWASIHEKPWYILLDVINTIASPLLSHFPCLWVSIHEKPQYTSRWVW
jgi:hypothetical protein